MTPEEWQAVVRAFEEKQEMENFRAGLIAAAVYNSAPSAKRRPVVQPLDFFQRRHNGRTTDQALLATLEAIAKCKSA